MRFLFMMLALTAFVALTACQKIPPNLDKSPKLKAPHIIECWGSINEMGVTHQLCATHADWELLKGTDE